ncbi:unnamed protein product [Rotaria sp. Silwood2]|nr:unnamed protein product [Rotaria sp. Silwood2]CAF2898703.1 unnamed protein product [Rotaria sp. Silwood2]CAF3320085.1 unnamed protein product [Rotaria sp. Silwood2]CAF3983168.1 unnamed protein product [Rotaria sp. Silwood2]CAF4115850.1 unnamed protein product [Rotaria sp. Silwood2]
MFIRLWVTSILLIIVVQTAVTNSSKGQTADSLKLLKQDPLDYDYDLNDQKLLGNNIEGSGGAASLDEYADDDEEEELSKVTANIISSSMTSTITTTTTTTAKSTTIKTTTTTTILLTPWMRTTFNYEQRNERNRTTSTTTLSAFNDLDASEFKDDNEEYADDLEDDAYYNEFTVTNKMSTTTTHSTTRYLTPTTRQSLVVNHTAPIWILFKFLTRPPIAAGILAAIGIFTSIILLICIIQRYHKREKSHSSYTTGLLYPNQYGYSKSPQEFYA